MLTPAAATAAAARMWLRLLTAPPVASRACLSPQAMYRMVNTSCIAEFSVVAEPPSRPAGAELPPIPAVNAELCKTREQRAVEKAKAEGGKVCVEATAFGQSLFNELSKTMPCDWMIKDGQEPSILVMSAVLINPPYGPDTCNAGKNEAKLKERVQKVVGGILQRVEAEYAAIEARS